ncbi:MBOAT family protein [Acutalibacter sp. 1XD8-33]|uniref:MBOAT family O-acyltransferase n=1 Tax=Acutalibacter sp. 1XD8-33 TaxID=2320081 RepID=UPI000EA23A1B|nr:MBOAT family O-acyltransferase [Acutalibacter sp. 1XD8-33]RKJ39038.1 MBOAT family protein [Acutalibacter sp. 1XD8-33]
MVFADLFFIYIFLPLVLICYLLARSLPTKNAVLIVFSLIFYAWGEPLWVVLLVFSSLLNWAIGLVIERNRGSGGAKAAVAAGIVIDIALLVIFKYSGFLVENLNALTGLGLPVPQIRMPIGISFFTFQAISYILDCYWETVKVQRHYTRFLLYLSLFPQLIAGPIVRYSVVEDEIENRSVTPTDLCEGALRVIIGLSKKVILANNLWAIVDVFFGKDITGLSVLGTWYTVIVYSLYVYFDFSGYSDIAIGLGRMFGFHFDENFRHPFACKTIAEFWQRWHISLGSFFRDYLLYVPIFGQNRKYLSLFLVWFCTGVWHGAAWNYMLWGLYFGFFIFFEQKLGKKRIKSWPLWWKHIYSKLVIIIGFGIFYFEDLGQLGQFFLNISGISMLANSAPFFDPITWSSLLNNLFLVAASIAFSLPILPKVKGFFLENSSAALYTAGRVGSAVACLGLLAVVSVLLVDSTNNVFLYWRF